MLKIAFVNKFASDPKSNPQPNIPRPYLVKSLGSVSINLEAALLFRSILDFFFRQVEIARHDEKDLIKRSFPFQITLCGSITSVFINSVLTWKRTDQTL